MALLPYLFDDALFGHSRSSSWDEPADWPLMLPNRTSDHLRDLRSQLAHFDQGASVVVDKDHFQANIDVQQFRPDEISVKLLDDHTVKVQAKHEEQQDDHGFITRQFVRRYLLPKDCDARKLQTKLSADGILIITAPKKNEDEEGEDIPILHIGRPIIRRPHLWPSHHGTGDRKRKLSS